MSKKRNEYDELLSYKVPDEDIKKIADTFIFLQNDNSNIQLHELFSFYKKKIDIDKFSLILRNAKEFNIILPFEEFVKTQLVKLDFVNFVEGYLWAKRHEIDTKISDLENFAYLKINLKGLIESIVKLRKYEPELGLSDFKKCDFCLYKPSELVDTLIKLKELDDKISIKKIISLQYTKSEINKILDLYKITQRLNHPITIHELFRLSDEGNKIETIVKALQTAKKAKIDIEIGKIIALDTAGENVDNIIVTHLKGEHFFLRPVHTNVKDGFEIIVKSKVSIRPNIFDFFAGINKDSLISKIEESIITRISHYHNLSELTESLGEVSREVMSDALKIKSSYIVDNISIVDVITGRNLKFEMEIELLKAEKQAAELRAKIMEANFKVESVKPSTHENEKTAHH